jgi:hypothetical protein
MAPTVGGLTAISSREQPLYLDFLPGICGAGDENRTRRSQLGNEFPLIFGGFQRTSADELGSSDELSGQLRTPADDSESAKFGPWREVKVTLPSAVVGALENAAAVLGVSLETLLGKIITRPAGDAANEDLGRGE